MGKKSFCTLILESPGLKTFFASIIPILTGVMSALFIMEISTPEGIEWQSFYKAFSFYVLLILVLVVYSYNKAIYLYEKSIARFMDNDYCIAYMRSQCLPEAAEKYKQSIRDGQGGELESAMVELRSILE